MLRRVFAGQSMPVLIIGVGHLILVCAGARGLARHVTPFAFVPTARGFVDGTRVVAGKIAHGRATHVARAASPA
jgi:hypothetical protein